MRIGCSALNAHLYYNLHVVDNPSCPCGYPNEDPNHYFLECNLYLESRNILMLVIEPHTNIHDILYGVAHETADINKVRLDALYTYIRSTERFTNR